MSNASAQTAERFPETVREVAFHAVNFVRLESREIAAVFREAFQEWQDDKAPRLGAALAYYTLLSVAPLLVVTVCVAALALGRKAVEGQLFWQMQALVGPDGALAIQGLLRNAFHPGSGIFSAAAA